MSYNANVFRVMIASPNDIREERNIIREVIMEWNSNHSEDKSMVLLPLAWEHDSYPLSGSPPQDILNRELLDKCDLLVAIFGTTIGTPTKKYISGTVEEIEEFSITGKKAMVYFSKAFIDPDDFNPGQYEKLRQFKADYRDRGLYQEYRNISEFEKKFRSHLQKIINNESYFEGSEITDIGEDVFELFGLDRAKDLSDEAITLLIETAKDPNGQFMKLLVMDGFIIQTNGKRLNKDSGPREKAKWESAVRELDRINFIQDVGHNGEIFELTDSAWRYLEKKGWLDD